MSAKRLARRFSRPTMLAIGSVLLILVGVSLFATGLRHTVNRVRTQVGATADPTSELQALSGVPGSSVTQLPPGTYQVVGVGPNLTETRATSDPTGPPDVVRRDFVPPNIEVVGPSGTMRLVAPTVNYVVDGTVSDAASLVEFTVRNDGLYQLFAKEAGDGSVERLGVRERDDLGEVVRDPARIISRMLLGAAFLVVGVVLLVIVLRKRTSVSGRATAAAGTARSGGGITTPTSGPSATGATRTPIPVQPNYPVPPSTPPRPPSPPPPPPPASPESPPPLPPPASTPPPPPAPAGVEPSWPPNDWPPTQPGRPGSSLPPPPPPSPPPSPR